MVHESVFRTPGHGSRRGLTGGLTNSRNCTIILVQYNCPRNGVFGMDIRISLTDGVPIYRQIVNQVKYLLASGQLLPGDELPAIRVLAQQILVNPNTVVRAYQQLEAENVVRKRRGAGTYVSQVGSPLARDEREKILAQRADVLLAEARQMNFAFDEVIRLLQEREKLLNEGELMEEGHGKDQS